MPHRGRVNARPRRSFALILLLSISAVGTLAVLFALMLAKVPLGQGYFRTLYSPLPEWRLERTIPVLVVGVCACGAVWALAQRERASRATGAVLLTIAMLSAGAWTWWAPPEPVNQQVFNMGSNSTDGAFVIE